MKKATHPLPDSLPLSAQPSGAGVRGKIVDNAPLGASSWFGCGGDARLLFRPEDRDDLVRFVEERQPCPSQTVVVGALSNVIVRDGGIPGLTLRLGKGFAGLALGDGATIRAGAAALDATLARFAAEQEVGGLEFFSGIPGSVGGAVRMNAGCYGTETKDVLLEVTVMDAQGRFHTLTPGQLAMGYRTSALPPGSIVVEALFQGHGDSPARIAARMQDIRERREASQPLREKTGGSTFANPSASGLEAAGLAPDTKVWQLIDRVGGRGLTVGGARMSEKHCNFMINTGGATASDLETLGEILRSRVLETFGVSMQWEIKRLGLAPADSQDQNPPPDPSGEA